MNAKRKRSAPRFELLCRDGLFPLSSDIGEAMATALDYAVSHGRRVTVRTASGEFVASLPPTFDDRWVRRLLFDVCADRICPPEQVALN